MKNLFCCYFILLMICLKCKSIESGNTSIEGIVLAAQNRSTRPLRDNKMILMIKNEQNHHDVHYIKLTINQNTFPFTFNLTNLNDITYTADYLLALLIFSPTHRLLWEDSLRRQTISVNRVNHITFVVNDVSNLPVCLAKSYPCVQTDSVDNTFVSTCCSDTKCQLSSNNQLTCSGVSPIVTNMTVSYRLANGIIPNVGSTDQASINLTEKLYQRIADPGTIVKVNNAIISTDSKNTNYDQSIDNTNFLLNLDMTITASEKCITCRAKTLSSIQNASLPFNILTQDGLSRIVTLTSPAIKFTSTSGIWITAGSVRYPRARHTASVLSNGKLLVVGGYDRDETIPGGLLYPTEVYDPLTNTWTFSGNIKYPRSLHRATVLRNGKVLVTGGYGVENALARVEVYDSLSNTWTSTTDMLYGIGRHTASLLINDTVLVAGGEKDYSFEIRSMLYNSLTGVWKSTSNMTKQRNHHLESVLTDGRILVTGGYDGNTNFSAISTTELYDPVIGRWTSSSRMIYARLHHTSSVLLDGKVLVTGGLTGLYPDHAHITAELYHPQNNRWTSVANMMYRRAGHTASVLPNGTVLVIGGYNYLGPSLDGQATIESYNPHTNTWTVVKSLTYGRYYHTTSILPSGSLLIVGGYKNRTTIVTDTELYTL